ncbi:MAG: amidohydrolase family protein [Actinomycetaceae bacterium]|nr:amidohydrolase family protein [Actinomycetaceae bacterium]
MNPTIIRGRLLHNDVIDEDGVILVENSVIRDLGDSADVVRRHEELAESIAAAEVLDATLVPGLVDVHCHGGGGESFPNAETVEQAMVAIMEHRRYGTTSLVASCVTADPEVLRQRGRLLGALASDGELVGVHFEGPFVSHERKGAQDGAYIIPPDPQLTRELMEATAGMTVSMTVAPEKEGAYGSGSVAEVLIEGGALPSWGHTDADPLAAREALEFSRQCLEETGEERRRSGHVTVTHLFNGMRPLHHRDPGPIMEFLADAANGGAIVELICDGIHVDPALVRSVVDALGRDGCVLITDAMAAAGMPDGEYQLGPQAVTVAGGVARLSGQEAIAGGTAHLVDCVRIAVTAAGIPLADAVYMASAQGAKIVGREDIGVLKEGARADILALDRDLRPISVWRAGKLVK